MPEGVIAINEEGYILSGDTASLKKKQNLFHYIATMYDLKILKRALEKADNLIPQVIEISFICLGQKADYLCNIFLTDGNYLIGIWRIPEKILYFPLKGTAAW